MAVVRVRIYITIVTAEAAIPYSKTYLGDIDARTSYHTYLRGDSEIAMAMAQIQLALANYGTHKEVADGNSDARFDLIAAFVASGRGTDLYTVQEMLDATVDDNGVIMAASACKQDATEPCETFSIKVVAGWVGCPPEDAFSAPCETAEEFNVITNTAIADGVITDA